MDAATIAMRYQRLLDEVAACAVRYGRPAADVTLVAVTKTQSLEALMALYQAGGRIFAESRVQELLPKKEAAPNDIAWHLIGSLQKNKVAKVIGQCALIHSVDSLALATKIAAVSQEHGLQTSVLLQVNISGEASKHGFTADELQASFAALMALPNLAIQGLMTMAPAGAPAVTTTACFAGLRRLRDTLSRDYAVSLPSLSMGMSDDYPIAIAEGATLVRIGSALFTP